MSLPDQKGFPRARGVKTPANAGDRETWVGYLAEDPREGVATHSSILLSDRGAWWLVQRRVGPLSTQAFMSVRRTLCCGHHPWPQNVSPSVLLGEEPGWRKGGPWPQVGEGHIRREFQ